VEFPAVHLREQGWNKLFEVLAPGAVFIDVKSAVARGEVPLEAHYWSL
jgi:hypothetical protein